MAERDSEDSGPASGQSKALLRKRLHPSQSSSQEEDNSPKRVRQDSGDEEEDDPELAALAPPSEEEEDEGDLLLELPPEALRATTLPQFTTQMKPYLWMNYPSATSAEVSALIHSKWKALRALRKAQTRDNGERRRCSEVDALGGGGDLEEGDDSSGRRTSRRRAAKNLATNVYTLDRDDVEFVDSPASSSRDVPMATSSASVRGRPVRRGRKKQGKSEPKVPPMKIKMIGRSGDNDSPIFFAESMDWEEGSAAAELLRVRRAKQGKGSGVDSETSSLQLGDDDIAALDGSSKAPSEEEEEEEEEEEGVPERDSEGEHADYCYTCKDVGELLCCDVCPKAYHLPCLVPPMAAIPHGEWRCPRCEAKPLGGKVERIITWRWREEPVSGEGGEELEDDVIESEGKSPEKRKPQKMYRFREFLVKWAGKSHWNNSWVSEIRLDVHQHLTLRPYMRRRNMEAPPILELAPHVQHRRKRRSTASLGDERLEETELMLLQAGIRPQWLQIHRILNKRSSRRGKEYLVKWRELSYDQATWERLDESCHLHGAQRAVEQYEQLRLLMDPRKKEKKRGRPKSKHSQHAITKKYEEQPDYITATGGKLHPYQLEGLNWLRFSWSQHTNTILADEMGLGKTIQTIAFLYSLFKEGYSNGPFLISAPLSTIVNWQREFEFWAPDLYVVTYQGDRDNRAVIRQNEFSFVEGAVRGGAKANFKVKKDAPIKFHVLLTSYEYISVDSTVLQSIRWEVLVVDEAHRLKNNQSKFFRVLNAYNLKYKLLLTGTPLQNNLEELFHLLNFLNPDSFSSLEDFQDEFEDISKEEQVQKLHELLGPHLLRRLKSDVLKNIPSKTELIVRVELSAMQKNYYRWILTKNFEKLNTRGQQPVSLLNIMMDLKKCCNHPYLFPTAAVEAPLTATGYYEGTALIQASGKFVVLHKMLKQLRKEGHRMLIFSQMTRMLDILEDFLEYLGYQYERIDGNVPGQERQQSIDRFNAPDAPQFVFLLSTRAGGLGINLASADTVVIYDSDWNPHNDIQAFSRAHRIGQSNKVMIYRFVTRGSVEERITEVAKRKMMLTHLVVRPGMGSANSQSLTKRELDDILRFGTADLFKEDKTSEGKEAGSSIHYDDEAISALLDRSQEGGGEMEQLLPGSDENLMANEYLSSFKVASYVMKEKEQDPEPEILKQEAVEETDPNFWEKLLRHHYEQQRELEAAKLGKGKRVRKQVNYLDASGGLEKSGRDSDQSSYQQSDEERSEEESDEDIDFAAGGAVAGGKKKGLKQGRSGRWGKEEMPPLLAKVNDTIQVLGFNSRQRKAYVNAVMRQGMPAPSSFSSSSSTEQWRPRELRNVPDHIFHAYTNMFLRHLCEPDNANNPTYSDGVPKETTPRQNILTRIGIMRLVRNKVEQYGEINGELSLPDEAVPIVKKEPVVHSCKGPPSEEQSIFCEENPGASAVDQMAPKSDSSIPIPEPASNDMTPVSGSKDATPVSDVSDSKSPMSKDSTPDPRPDSKPATPPSTEKDEAKEGADSEPKAEGKESTGAGGKPRLKFMFNIADGGFTELHTLWADEKTKGFSPAVWGRHHDYWLLKGIVTHGYCRWSEICADQRFVIVNRPFGLDDSQQTITDSKSRFYLKRFKLLEQALAVEEQLHRASNAGLVQDPNRAVMQLHSHFTDLDCLADGHAHLSRECMDKEKNSIQLMRKALGKMEELLLEMKSDVSRLPAELSKIPSVSKQLKMDEISILSKLAQNKSVPIAPAPPVVTTPSVITQAPSGNASSNATAAAIANSAVVAAKKIKKERQAQQQEKSSSVPAQQYPVAYASPSSALVQAPVHIAAGSIAAGSSIAVQTPEGVIMYSVANDNVTQTPAVVQQAGSSNAGSSSYATAIGVPYMEGGNLYQAVQLQGQTVQLVPVSGEQVAGQQVVYWPTTSGAQLAVVQQPGSQAVLQYVDGSSGTSNIITID